MSDIQLKHDLARAKMEKAREAWEEALWCFKGEKYPATINRLYYSMYRACLAILAFESKIPVKHTAVIGHVNKKYVKEGLLPKELGRFLHRLQTARVEGDYKGKEFTREEVEELIAYGETALTVMENLVEKIIFQYKKLKESSELE
ncbi:MAG: HEPN domain-containing protein [Peptococcaceae bacterium]|nr:HEPN domain-containing protein [Peptococcaceae bacterium]